MILDFHARNVYTGGRVPISTMGCEKRENAAVTTGFILFSYGS